MTIEELREFIAELMAALKEAQGQLANLEAEEAEAEEPIEPGEYAGWNGPYMYGSFSYDPLDAVVDMFANSGGRVEQLALATEPLFLCDFLTTPPGFENTSHQKFFVNNYNEAQRRRTFLGNRHGFKLRDVFSRFVSEPGPYNLPNRAPADPSSKVDGVKLIWDGNNGAVRARENFEKYVKSGKCAYVAYYHAVHKLARLDRMYENASADMKAQILSNNPGYKHGPRVATATSANPYRFDVTG